MLLTVMWNVYRGGRKGSSFFMNLFPKHFKMHSQNVSEVLVCKQEWQEEEGLAAQLFVIAELHPDY